MSQQSGFTLMELLLSSIILGYVILMVMLSIMNCSILNEDCRNQVIATNHANYILEDIRNTTFSSISTNINAGNWDWNATTVASNGFTALNSESIDVSVSGSSVLDVTIVVNWENGNNRTRSITYKTKISA